MQEIGKGKWAMIADNLGTGRSASGVEQHWQIMIGQRKRNSSAKTPPKPAQPLHSMCAAAPATMSAQSTISLHSSSAPIPASHLSLDRPVQVVDPTVVDASKTITMNQGALTGRVVPLPALERDAVSTHALLF